MLVVLETIHFSEMERVPGGNLDEATRRDFISFEQPGPQNLCATVESASAKDNSATEQT